MTGGAGDDTLDGGNGNDWILYDTASGPVTVNLAANTVSGGAGNDSLVGIETRLGVILCRQSAWRRRAAWPGNVRRAARATTPSTAARSPTAASTATSTAVSYFGSTAGVTVNLSGLTVTAAAAAARHKTGTAAPTR